MKMDRCALAVVVSLLMAGTSQAKTLFADNFDSDTAGTFPAGWSLLYDGAGTSYQTVSTTHAVSAPNALNLVGSSCWSSDAYHPVSFEGTKNPDKYVVLKGDIFIGQIGYGGCGPETGRIALWNPSIGEWGTAYTGVQFEDDGYIYAISAGSYTRLQTYKINKWYRIKVNVDLKAQTSDIYVDNKLIAIDVPFALSGLPTGINLDAGHGTTPEVWFDDISIEN